MSSNKGNTNDTDKTGDIISWVIVFILLFAFPPAGWIFLLIKLGVFANRKVKNQSNYSKNNNNTRNNATANHVYQPVNNEIVNQANGTINTGTSGHTYNTGTAGYSINAGSFTNTKPNIKTSNKKRNRLNKKTGKGLSVFLLFLSIIQFIISFSGMIAWISGGMYIISDLILSLLFLSGGLITFFSRNIIPRRLSRYKNYYAFIEGRGVIPISEIVQIAGLSPKKVTADLQAMINNGYLDSGAYIDYGLDCLVLSAEEANRLRMEIMGEQDITSIASQTDEMPLGQDAAILAELREVNSFINDEAISAKVHRLVELTGKIFKIVEDSPEKKPQLRRFSSYYLPTTLKLVRSYATLEKQGVKGENIMSTKKSIGEILDTLSTGFEQQLDQLFKSDAIDIASDINVLENLMQQDGLTDDKSEFQVAASSGTF